MAGETTRDNVTVNNKENERKKEKEGHQQTMSRGRSVKL